MDLTPWGELAVQAWTVDGVQISPGKHIPGTGPKEQNGRQHLGEWRRGPSPQSQGWEGPSQVVQRWSLQTEWVIVVLNRNLDSPDRAWGRVRNSQNSLET